MTAGARVMTYPEMRASWDSNKVATQPLWFVQLCEHRGQPWGTPRVVRANSPEDAARQAFPIPPSSLHVKHAWVAALAEPYQPTQVEIDVPKPKWGKARPANPQAREPRRVDEVDGPVVGLSDWERAL